MFGDGSAGTEHESLSLLLDLSSAGTLQQWQAEVRAEIQHVASLLAATDAEVKMLAGIVKMKADRGTVEELGARLDLQRQTPASSNYLRDEAVQSISNMTQGHNHKTDPPEYGRLLKSLEDVVGLLKTKADLNSVSLISSDVSQIQNRTASLEDSTGQRLSLLERLPNILGELSQSHSANAADLCSRVGEVERLSAVLKSELEGAQKSIIVGLGRLGACETRLDSLESRSHRSSCRSVSPKRLALTRALSSSLFGRDAVRQVKPSHAEGPATPQACCRPARTWAM